MEEEGSQFCPIKILASAMVEVVSRWLCLVAGASQQPSGVFSRSGFYYLPDVGLVAILLEHQVSWWKDGTRTAFNDSGLRELCLHVRAGKA